MSNIVGDIYGIVKDGKSSIILNSNTIDISGTLTTHGHIQLFQSNHEITGTPDPSGIINRFNTVINIPTTDSDGNALTANTTYEMTTGPAGSINNISFVKKQPANSIVYFSVQLGSNAQSHGGETSQRYINHLNELQSDVHPNTRGLAGYSDTWDVSSIVSSDDQSNFATNGYIVPRTGVYKIDCYQTIKSMISNSALGGLRVYRNPIANGNYYQDSTCLAATEESESGDGNPPRRSESLVWLGQLNQGDAIKFMITCDNGFGPNGSMYKSCYTIMSVD